MSIFVFLYFLCCVLYYHIFNSKYWHEKLLEFKMAKKTIEEIDKQRAQLQAQKDAILMRQKNAEREQSTRQKIVLGGWLLANDLALVEKVKAGLTRDQDRKAFGLEPLQVQKQVQKTADNVEAEVFQQVFVTH